jgi:hypothetical protein
MRGAIHPPHQYASMPWCSIKKNTGITLHIGVLWRRFGLCASVKQPCPGSGVLQLITYQTQAAWRILSLWPAEIWRLCLERNRGDIGQGVILSFGCVRACVWLTIPHPPPKKDVMQTLIITLGGGQGMHTQIWSGNFQRKRELGILGVGGKIILKWSQNKRLWRY